MTNTDAAISRIDSTLDAADDPTSVDAMRWQPVVTSYAFAALLVPADLTDSIRLVDLDTETAAGVRQLIGCHRIDKITVDGAGGVSTDFLFDEDGDPSYRSDAVLNKRATELTHALKMAQFTGDYPSPPDLDRQDLAFDAAMWRWSVRLFGPVVIVGADERTGEWIPVPERLLEFMTEALDVDLTEGQPEQPAGNA